MSVDTAAGTPAAKDGSGRARRGGGLLQSQVGILLGFLAVLVVIFTLKSESHHFWSSDNLWNVLSDVCPILLLAIGEMYVVISGGIDLSVGSNAAASGVVASLAMRNLTGHGMSPYPALFLGLLCAVAFGVLVGVVNSLLVNYAKLVPFVATLATLGICAGLAVVWTKGGPVDGGTRTEAIDFAKPAIWAFSKGMLIVFAITFVAGLYLHRTRFGRHTYAMGSNPFAARAAGISLQKHTMKVYVLSGFLAGLAGMYYFTRLGSGSPSSGITKELDAIAAVVIGGVALTGGVGTMAGVVLGTLILSTVANGLVFIGVQPNWRQVVVGALIAVAGAFQALRKTNGRPS